MTLDLAQFHQSFFEESFEALDAMEAALLKLDVGVVDADSINTIFRGAHSMKGGAAMLGFDDVTSFTHTLETLLDELRSGRKQVSAPMLDTLLKSVDVLREMLRAVQSKQPVNAQRVADVQFDLETLVVAKEAPSPAALPTSVQSGAAGTAAPETYATTPGWTIGFKPLPHLLLQGNDPLAIFAALKEMGRLEAIPDLSAIPPLTQVDPQICYVSWLLKLHGECSREHIDETFDWTTGDCELSIQAGIAAQPAKWAARPADSGQAPAAESRQATAAESTQAPAAESSRAPAAESSRAPAAESTQAAPIDAPQPATAKSAAASTTAPAVSSTAASTTAPAGSSTAVSTTAPPAGAPESGSIRVGIDKIDELINTVGELVITQAMLSELGRTLEGAGADLLRTGLAQLERSMRQLQEGVMRVRMLPISVAFSRFPRMVHDLAQRLGKKIELKVTGEQTELDKTVLEKIGDPLVHLVRNSIDHGVETPEVRAANGKPPFGTVSLNAYHSGGNIAVEVSDDGAGLDKARILAKARSRGLVGANDVLTDEQIYELIFLPGFSTAEKTTEVSGRGVGMDVVRQRVKELGGSVDIRSEPGRGSRFLITLPLTLSIVDGQSVLVGSECYIVPLTSIVESLQLKPQSVSRLSGAGEVFSFRGDYLPLVRLHELFGVEPRSRSLQDGLVVIAEGDGRRIGLFVDELLGQQQVVIKSMESNYGHIEGIAGATILGDGSVALILDVSGLIRAASVRRAA